MAQAVHFDGEGSLCAENLRISNRRIWTNPHQRAAANGPRRLEPDFLADGRPDPESRLSDDSRERSVLPIPGKCCVLAGKMDRARTLQRVSPGSWDARTRLH